MSAAAETAASFATMLTDACRRHAAKTAVISGDRHLGYAELESRMATVAAGLRAAGAQPGERIAVAVDERVDFLVATLAAISYGFVAVIVDSPSAEAQSFVMRDAAVRIAVADGFLRAEVPEVTVIATADAETGAGAVAAPVVPAEAEAIVLYTSGTAGLRKGVICTQANLAATTRYVTKFMAMDDSVIEYVASPINHAFGFGRCRFVLACGGTLVLDPKPFNPLRGLAILDKHACNSFAAASTAFAMLIEHMGAEFAKLAGRLHWMEIGSVPLRRDLIDRLCQAFPVARAVMNYGMTEAQRSTLIDFNQTPAGRGSVGRASPGCRVEIRTDDGAAEPGTIGTIWVAGPHVANGYLGHPAITAERFRDGWFQTDDLGRQDAAGFVEFIGRRDDLINFGGDKLSPVEIEHAIEPVLAGEVFSVCGISDPSGMYGEVPVLCIESETPETYAWSEIKQRFAKLAGAAELPRMAVVVARLPRTGNGKVQRGALREMMSIGHYTSI